MTFDAKAEARICCDAIGSRCLATVVATVQEAYAAGLREGAERERAACADIADEHGKTPGMWRALSVAAAIRARAKGGG